MNPASDQFANARKDALARMQKRWGQDRKDTKKPETGPDEPDEIPFIELSDEDLDLALRVPTPAHLADLKQALREIRQERYAELQDAPSADAPTAPISKRSELLAEIASDHFRSGMMSWLTSIPVDHGLSATPADELVRIQDELRYRLGLVKAIENMMSREIEGLETQIKARRLLDA